MEKKKTTLIGWENFQQYPKFKKQGCQTLETSENGFIASNLTFYVNIHFSIIKDETPLEGIT